MGQCFTSGRLRGDLPVRGVVHFHFGLNSFKAQDICEALKEVRAKIGEGNEFKLAMMWYNARIH